MVVDGLLVDVVASGLFVDEKGVVFSSGHSG